MDDEHVPWSIPAPHYKCENPGLPWRVRSGCGWGRVWGWNCVSHAPELDGVGTRLNGWRSPACGRWAETDAEAGPGLMPSFSPPRRPVDYVTLHVLANCCDKPGGWADRPEPIRKEIELRHSYELEKQYLTMR